MLPGAPVKKINKNNNLQFYLGSATGLELAPPAII